MDHATTVDFGAVARVSRYAELKDIRLIEITARCSATPAAGLLKPDFFSESSIAQRGEDFLHVDSTYRFVGSEGTAEVLAISIKYLVVYQMTASAEPLADDDLLEFAKANGTLHSWPFVRESLHALTYKMGLPPFLLGVMHFVPQRHAPKNSDSEGDLAKSEEVAEES